MIKAVELRNMLIYNPENGDFVWKVDRGTNKMTGKVEGINNKNISFFIFSPPEL